MKLIRRIFVVVFGAWILDSTNPSPLNRCGYNQVGCDGSCRDADIMCNDIKNCKDGADEDRKFCGHCPTSYFRCDIRVCHPVEALCDGIKDCKDGTDENQLCKETCSPPRYFECRETKECLIIRTACNGEFDCRDRSDEDKDLCNKPLEVSLTGGRDGSSGIVHVKFLGFWGTICGDKLTDKEAKVICQALGYDGPASAHRRGFMGEGDGLIWLKNFKCTGTEKNLRQCSKLYWGMHVCLHSEDFSVTCSKKNQFLSKAVEPECGTSDYFMPKHVHYEKEVSELFTPMKDLPTPWCVRPSGYVSEQGRIVHGSLVVEIQNFPWMAGIFSSIGGKSYHVCGGTIVTEYFVLTAAHCVIGRSITELLIRIGEYDLDLDSYSEDDFELDNIFIHPYYKQDQFDYDISLLKIKPKAGHGIVFNLEALPVCLPSTVVFEKPRLNLTVAGWGKTEHGSYARLMRMAEVEIFSQEYCEIIHNGITQNMMCAGVVKKGGSNACKGDSGGPLVVKVVNRTILLGLVSWGKAECPRINLPGVFVRVRDFLPWILEKMEQACDGLHRLSEEDLTIPL